MVIIKKKQTLMNPQLFYIDETFYLVVLTLTKVSILYFYLRVFPNRLFPTSHLRSRGLDAHIRHRVRVPGHLPV